MNDGKTKASSMVGKSMTKNNRKLHSQHSMVEIHSLNRTVQMKWKAYVMDIANSRQFSLNF